MQCSYNKHVITELGIQGGLECLRLLGRLVTEKATTSVDDSNTNHTTQPEDTTDKNDEKSENLGKETTAETKVAGDSTMNSSDKKEDAAKTGEESLLGVVIILAVAAAATYTIRRKKQIEE